MNILFLSSWFPLPANNGSKLRALHLLNSLTKKHRVSLLSFVDGAEAGPDLRGMGEMCDVLGVEPVIHFNPRGLKALSAFVSPLPRIAQEAMALGLPVLASRVGGLPELVMDNQTGLLFAPGDDADLARQLARLMQDASLRERLARAGREHVRKEYSMSRMVDEVVKELF